MIDSLIAFFSKILHLPVLASENGKPVDELIIYIHWLMIALFVGWFAYFCYCLWRFNAKRNPKADHEGAKSHASSWIEVFVAGIEVVILVGFVCIGQHRSCVDGPFGYRSRHGGQGFRYQQQCHHGSTEG